MRDSVFALLLLHTHTTDHGFTVARTHAALSKEQGLGRQPTIYFFSHLPSLLRGFRSSRTFVIVGWTQLAVWSNVESKKGAEARGEWGAETLIEDEEWVFCMHRKQWGVRRSVLGWDCQFATRERIQTAREAASCSDSLVSHQWQLLKIWSGLTVQESS